MPVPATVSRAFWSLYGRYAWVRVDPRTAVIERILALLDAAGARPGDRVLDAGCGTGEVSLACARAGFHVVAADFAPGMLQWVRQRQSAAPVLPMVVQQTDLATRLPWPDAHFDHALAISVLQALPDPSATLREVARVVRVGGTLVLLHRSRLTPDVGAAGAGSTPPFWRWLKRVGDRYGSRYWSPATVAGLVRDSGFTMLAEEGDELVLMSARRTQADLACQDARSSLTGAVPAS